jgi:parallel beta-helix repeat protein
VRGAAAVVAALLAAVLTTLAAAPAAAGECPKPDDPPDEGWEPYRGTDPNRVRLPYTPWRLLATPCPFPAEFRAVVVEPGRVILLEAGQFLREVPLAGDGELRFEDVARAVNDPAWLAETEPGVFVVDTAFVQRRTTLVAAAPAVREIRLTTRPHVFFGGLGSTARFDGVTVTSWDPAAAGPDQEPRDGRAFVLYRDASRLDIVRSRFQYLGSDRSEAYGVSWRARSTGSALESTFANSFFGAYTFEAEHVVFRNNVFRDNVRYGLDPHDHSHHLTIEGNEAVGNGIHGIVFSSSVTASVIRGNTVHHNRVNGIVLHGGSSNTVGEGNRVEHNGPDGIVLIDSGDVRVAGNTVRGHQVGIRANGSGSRGVTVQGNTLEDNRVGLQAYGGADGVRAEGNVYRRSAEVAILLAAPQAEVRQDQIVGGRLGVDVVSGRAALQSVRITEVDEGVVARGQARADVRGADVHARLVGMRAPPGSVAVRDGVVHAPRPFSWTSGSGGSGPNLGYVGLAALGLALCLQALSVIRNRGLLGGPAPAHVRNTA